MTAIASAAGVERPGRTRRAPQVAARALGRDIIDRWLASKGWRAWPFQQQAWEAYGAGHSGLIQVATGAGKTYGAYLGPLAELIDEIGDCGSRIVDCKPEAPCPIRNSKSTIRNRASPVPFL